jgi:hypothetical protein
MECEDIRTQLKAFVDKDLEDPERAVVCEHLDGCRDCSRAARQLGKLAGALQAWKAADLPAGLYERLQAGLRPPRSWWRKALTPAFAWRAALRFAEAAAIVVITLAVSGRFRKPQIAPPDDDLTTINFYVTEHQEAVLQTASMETAARQPANVVLSRDDIVYYEYVDEYRRIFRPGVILRGPDSIREAGTAAASDSGIAAAKALTLPEARAAMSFAPVAPARIHPGYILDSITKVAERESLHLLYTNGVDTFSVFEQPLGGSQGLAAEDFRKFAVYKSSKPAEGAGGQAGTTILAWKNTRISFVLIGRVDMSRMMEIAQVFADAGRSVSEFGE